METLYQLYFKLTSIRPLGQIDWAMRKLLGRYLNDASSPADMNTVRKLAELREHKSENLIKGNVPHIGTTPISHADIVNAGEGESLTKVVEPCSNPYILLYRGGEMPDSDLIHDILREGDCEPSIAVWELCPTITRCQNYIDPITLEIAFTEMSVVILRKSAIKDVGGFDNGLPQAAQIVDICYRLRANGYRLVHRNTMTGTPNKCSTASSVRSCDAVTKRAMRKKYSRLLSPFSRRDCGPSRLWRNGYELNFGISQKPNSSTGTIQPLVSIIIRTHEGRKHWLAESLHSVLNQSYQNIEVLIVEDGSDENRPWITELSKRMKGHPKSLHYLTQDKRGKSPAGNLGLAYANGEYLGFLDDDDLFYPHHVESLLDELINSPRVLAAYSLAWEVHTRMLSNNTYKEEHYEIARHTRGKFSQKKLEKLNFLPIQSVLFHRSLLSAEGGLDPERQYLEDWDLWLRYSRRTEFAHLPIVTSLYRTTADPYERIARVQLQQRRSIQLNGIAA